MYSRFALYSLRRIWRRQGPRRDSTRNKHPFEKRCRSGPIPPRRQRNSTCSLWSPCSYPTAARAGYRRASSSHHHSPQKFSSLSVWMWWSIMWKSGGKTGWIQILCKVSTWCLLFTVSFLTHVSYKFLIISHWYDRECQVAAWVSHKLVCGKVLRPTPSATTASPDVLMAAASAVQAAKSASTKQHHAM